MSRFTLYSLDDLQFHFGEVKEAKDAGGHEHDQQGRFSATGAHADAFHAAFKKLDAKGNNFVQIPDLRKELNLPKEHFDALVHHMRREGHYTASGFEGRHALSPEQIEGGIREKPGPGQATGTLLGYLSRRKPMS